jgi:hypothetical protein
METLVILMEIDQQDALDNEAFREELCALIQWAEPQGNLQLEVHIVCKLCAIFQEFLPFTWGTSQCLNGDERLRDPGGKPTV